MKRRKEIKPITQILKKTIGIFLVFSLFFVILLPILFALFPYLSLKIIFFPLWIAISQFTILIIERTALDEWISRAIALAAYSIISLALISWFGTLLFPYKYLFKKELRIPVVIIGCIICVSMSFITSGIYFNPMTGIPLKKYYEGKDGKIKFFPLEMNYNPQTGEPLKVVTTDIIERYKQHNHNTVLSTAPTSPKASEKLGANLEERTLQEAAKNQRKDSLKAPEKNEDKNVPLTKPESLAPTESASKEIDSVKEIYKDQFKFDLREVRQYGSNVTCKVTVENLGEKPKIIGLYCKGFSKGFSNLYNKNGKEFIPSIVWVGEKGNENYRVCRELFINVPVEFCIEFADVNNMDYCNVILHFEAGIYCNGDKIEIAFRNIPVEYPGHEMHSSQSESDRGKEAISNSTAVHTDAQNGEENLSNNNAPIRAPITNSEAKWIADSSDLMRKRDWQELQNLSLNWVKEYPEDCKAWGSLATAYANLGFTLKCIEAENKAVGICPEIEELWFGLALAYTKVGDKQNAIAAENSLRRINSPQADDFIRILENIHHRKTKGYHRGY